MMKEKSDKGAAGGLSMLRSSIYEHAASGMHRNNFYLPLQREKEASDAADWLQSMSPVVFEKCSRSEGLIKAM